MITDADFTALEKRCAKLEKVAGVDYMNTPQLTRHVGEEVPAFLQRLKDHFFATWATTANELPSGNYPAPIALQASAYIIADQRVEIEALKSENEALGSRVVDLEARPVGSVVVNSPLDIPALAQELAPYFGAPGAAPSVGLVPGAGYGQVMRDPVTGYAVTEFASGEFAYRLLTNCDPSKPDWKARLDKFNGRWEVEQDATWGLGVWAPANVSPGEHDYPNKTGKQLCFRPGGNDGQGRVGKAAQMYGGLMGRHFILGVSRTYPNVLDAVPGPEGEVYGDFKIDGDDRANPISLTSSGQNRKVVVKTVNGVEVFAPA